MKSGEIKVDEKGRIVIAGELTDFHPTHPSQALFEGYLDTGCSHAMVVPLEIANGIMAQVEKESTTSAGAGAVRIDGTMRRVNVCFGGLTARNVLVFVPNDTGASRVLIGIELLQNISAFLAIDFHLKSTQGTILTNDRKIPFLVGKLLHYKLVHGKEIVSTNSCEFCGEAGELAVTPDPRA